MSRTFFSRGLRGAIAKQIQMELSRQGFASGPPDAFVDGDFGGLTVKALEAFQTQRALAVTGGIDIETWSALTSEPFPGVFERCLGLTADFEGHGFELLQGNFDGAGLTWGIIGFTLASKEIQQLLQDAEAESPGILQRNLGPLTDQWTSAMSGSLADQIAFGDSLSVGTLKADVDSTWRGAFASLGREPVMQQLQVQRAKSKYFDGARTSAARLKLVSELGIALAFDVHVQNGGFKADVLAMGASLAEQLSEFELRMRLADAVADSAKPRYREDVRSRKKTIASGEGVAHGRAYSLASWGIDEFFAG